MIYSSAHAFERAVFVFNGEGKAPWNILAFLLCWHLQENPNAQPYVQKIPRPTDGAYTRVHQPVFPLINNVKVAEIIEEGMAKQKMQSKYVYALDFEQCLHL